MLKTVLLQEFAKPLPVSSWDKELWNLLQRFVHFSQNDQICNSEGTSLDTSVIGILRVARTHVLHFYACGKNSTFMENTP